MRRELQVISTGPICPVYGDSCTILPRFSFTERWLCGIGLHRTLFLPLRRTVHYITLKKNGVLGELSVFQLYVYLTADITVRADPHPVLTCSHRLTSSARLQDCFLTHPDIDDIRNPSHLLQSNRLELSIVPHVRSPNNLICPTRQSIADTAPAAPRPYPAP